MGWLTLFKLLKNNFSFVLIAAALFVAGVFYIQTLHLKVSVNDAALANASLLSEVDLLEQNSDQLLATLNNEQLQRERLEAEIANSQARLNSFMQKTSMLEQISKKQKPNNLTI
ncbi:hypothetical protein PH505_av00490 [Pseudoalteromonas distincta]|uniref:hypothetical protein n=1 Tax=Pseudoalteromonas distincta TaxID=77608 RepID=UPI00020A0A0E|nr:hypothetical protein [Pseudoalteromonas distincta]EGI73219.1 hypothetical protein PH505_av00490 [Pseudoalteromonas distincta]